MSSSVHTSFRAICNRHIEALHQQRQINHFAVNNCQLPIANQTQWQNRYWVSMGSFALLSILQSSYDPASSFPGLSYGKKSWKSSEYRYQIMPFKHPNLAVNSIQIPSIDTSKAELIQLEASAYFALSPKIPSSAAQSYSM